ncbi:MAG: hypothetical protein OEV44_04395 [Spirochaetota bacterium]|nr:hypothetical protein [Spirochaetota bacterium]
MANKSESYVWYACYGSNLSQKRFLCYIIGGTPDGSTKYNIGSKDKTLPKADEQIIINYPLYFAKRAKGWGNLGVAFIGLEKDTQNTTYGRIYLITEMQFRDVVNQENGNLDLPFNINQVIKQNSYLLNSDSWYSNVLYLGLKNDYPIFTFTSPKDMSLDNFIPPSHEYLSVIIAGLKETYGFTDKEIANYLITKPGITDNFTLDELINLINK